ncbi:MAG: hypothetical protein WBG95_17475 [Sulfitobacter sp.]
MMQYTAKPQDSAGETVGRTGKHREVPRTRLRRFALWFLVGVLAPVSAFAQGMCTPGNIAQNATSIELFDAAGNVQGGGNPDLSPGDLVVYRNAIIADYNANATVDVVYQILDIVTGPGGSARLNSGSGELELRGIAPPDDPYMTYRILVFVGGTLTNSIASGEPVNLMNARISLQDIDSNSNQNFSDAGGYLLSGPSLPSSINLSNTSALPFQNGGGPNNFATFLATPNPAGQTPPNFTNVPNTQDVASFSATFNYSSFEQGTFLHGVTGPRPDTLGGRGAVIAICGEILAPALEVEKSTVSEVENADGTTDITYRVTLRNTGGQDLDNLSVSDAVDTIFSTPVDVFIPSTTATATGGIIAVDDFATIVTDVGPAIAPIATNPNFDGGADLEILAQPSTATLSPGDEIFVDFTIRLFTNDSDMELSFINVAEVSVLDDFNIPIDLDAPASPVRTPPRNSTIELVKSVASVEDTNNSGAFGDAGDTVNYTFTVENTGRAALGQVVVSDTGIPGLAAVPVSGFDGDLAIGEGPVLAATARLVITAGDLATGSITNTAIVTAQPVATGANGQPDPTIPLINPGTGQAFAADSASDDSDTGSTPDLEFADGTVPQIADPADTNGANDPTVLVLPKPPVANFDSASGFTPVEVASVPNIAGNDTDDGTVQPDRISFIAPAGSTTLTDAEGDVISVTIDGQGIWAVDPAGNVTFTPEAGFEGNPDPINYTVLDDDGFESNPATITVTYNPLPAISVEKSADVSGLQSPPQTGDAIVYSYVVSNTGNVQLFDVAVNESAADFSGTGVLPTPVYVSGGADLDFDLDAFDLAPGSDTILFQATYRLTQLDIDSGGVTNQAFATGDNVTGTPVMDASDDPADPANALDNGDPADPTVVSLDQVASLDLIKVVLSAPDSNGDGLFGGEGDTVFYGFTVINTGNLTLDDIDIDDPLFNVTGGPITLLAGQADETTFRGELIVGPNDITRGFIENSATAEAEAANGQIPVAVSDTGTDPDAQAIQNPGEIESPDGLGAVDGNPRNDPTVLSVPANPNPGLALTKSITAVSDGNGNGITDAGDTIDYVFSVTNTGNLRLADITVTDPLLSVTGTTAILEVLEVNATALTGSYVIQPGDVTAGFVENTAQATGLAVNSLGAPILDPATGVQLSATDTSDSGTAPDLDAAGNPVSVTAPGAIETPDGAGGTDSDAGNDPTVLRIPMPQITLVKSVFDVADTNGDGLIGGPDDIITYAFAVTNTGSVDLASVTVDDALATVTGGPIVSLAVGQSDTLTFRATYMVTPGDITTGFVENTATASGAAVDENGNPFFGPAGDPVVISDVSDTGNNADGSAVTNPAGTETPNGVGGTDADPTNDPTVITVPLNPVAGVELVKSAVNVADTNNDAVTGAFGDLLTYSFAVTNTGNFPLGNVVVNDPVLGGPIGTIPLLRVNETITLSFDYEITFDDFTAGLIENTATASGTLTNASGAPIIDLTTGTPFTITDVSDTGTASDLSPVPNAATTETLDANGNTNGDPTDDPTVTQLSIIPSGAAVSGTFFVDNNRNDDFESGIDDLVPGVTVNLLNAAGQIVGTAVTDANGFFSIAGFPVGANFSLAFLDPVSGAVLDSIAALNFGPNTTLANQNGLTAAGGVSNLVLTKTSTRDTVILGDAVPYRITLTNTGTGPVPAVEIVDNLPVGLAFITGTATLNGAPVIPVVQGRTITISNVFVATGVSVDIRLFATVLPSAPFGDLTNTVQAIDPVSRAVLAEASATVERLPEAVFDCSDVIGKVFDDRNFNGYQDSAPTRSLSNRAVSNQNIFDGKLGSAGAARPVPDGEPGLPGVRLLTATGTQITTDEFGRYSVPCAELAGPIGTNFTLKLDPKSLPTGYRITTENPRTMRLTAGIATEMNFGATLGRVLDVDLTAAAFAQNIPVDRLDQGLAQLLRQVADTPTVVRISYFSNGEDMRTAQARIKAVEDVIAERWRKIGRYRLIVETTIKQLQ